MAPGRVVLTLAALLAAFAPGPLGARATPPERYILVPPIQNVEYILTPENFGVPGFNNLDPFDSFGKIRTREQYLLAIERARKIAQTKFPSPAPRIPPPGSYLGFLEQSESIFVSERFEIEACRGCAFR